MVLAAGAGTRLRRLTANCPKPLLPVGGQPVLVHILRWLRRHHVTDIGLNLHHLPQIITNFLGDGRRYGVNLRYSVEEQLLGTAGALGPLAGFLDTTFTIVYGDVLTNLDLGAMLAFHRRHGACLTLALYRVDNPARCGLVDLDGGGRVRRFVEKPDPDHIFTDLANGGIYIAEPAILEHIPRRQFYDFGHDLFPRLLAQGAPVYGYPIGDAYLIDMGTP
ncbi:MAG: NDP-sugar synthase, partial [Anaerolineae bacterium]